MEDHEYIKGAKAFVKDRGFPMPAKPLTEVPPWPRSVGDLTYEELAEHSTIWSGWAGYTRVLLAVASANQIAYESQEGIFRSKEMVKREGDYKTVTALKASIEDSDEMRQYRDNAVQSRVQKKLLRALLETYEKRVEVISRELTRRTKDIEDARRRT
jgi:hypothetical protein